MIADDLFNKFAGFLRAGTGKSSKTDKSDHEFFRLCKTTASYIRIIKLSLCVLLNLLPRLK